MYYVANVRDNIYADLWFVVKWTEEEEELFDVLPAKDISGNGKGACDMVEGDVGEGKFGKGWYPIRILAKGEVVCGFSKQMCENVVKTQGPCYVFPPFLCYLQY